MGRPKGSKNKPMGEDTGNVTVQRKTGRPKGRKSGYTVTEKALAQRREVGMKKVQPASTPEEFEYNSRLIEHIMRVNEIATHADKHDLLSLKSCFIAYLKLCQEDGFTVSNLSAYASMGFHSFGAFHMFIRKDDPEIREFATFVQSTCAMFRENMVANNKLNPVIGIFWQRNFDGLRNDTEQVQAARDMDEDDFTASKSYKDKYKNLIGG